MLFRSRRSRSHKFHKSPSSTLGGRVLRATCSQLLLQRTSSGFKAGCVRSGGWVGDTRIWLSSAVQEIFARRKDPHRNEQDGRERERSQFKVLEEPHHARNELRCQLGLDDVWSSGRMVDAGWVSIFRQDGRLLWFRSPVDGEDAAQRSRRLYRTIQQDLGQHGSLVSDRAESESFSSADLLS